MPWKDTRVIHIELTVMDRGPAALAELQELLKKFEEFHDVQVPIRVLEWENGWEQLVQMSQRGTSPAVSEVGSTWVGSFRALQALRPFSRYESAGLGGPPEFVAPAWESATGDAFGEMWAIPWLIDARVLYYRRDLLEKAGLDEEKALSSPETLVRSLSKLQEHIEGPWVVPTVNTRELLHNIATWVWEAGGHFLDQAGTQPRFAEPAALQGMHNYFSLYRFLNPWAYSLDAVQAMQHFFRGGAAVMVSGPWIPYRIREGAVTVVDEVRNHLGIASMPGPAFVGGSHLVIWQQAKHGYMAFELVKFLTQPSFQRAYCRNPVLLPARLRALDVIPFNDAENLRLRIVRNLSTGRSFRGIPLWGIVEDRLTWELNQVSLALMNNPKADIDALLQQHMVPLAERLALTLTKS